MHVWFACIYAAVGREASRFPHLATRRSRAFAQVPQLRQTFCQSGTGSAGLQAYLEVQLEAAENYSSGAEPGPHFGRLVTGES